jgi:hypothetical protein
MLLPKRLMISCAAGIVLLAVLMVLSQVELIQRVPNILLLAGAFTVAKLAGLLVPRAT